ncbi:DUF3089 domain-containing protein [Novosphingobium album (ex Liu et al. 2023)]|uniref:DUF3089 domain-containing protein n=1 Tax=Novosphingobium album (ex Liu et al. 2023) TaxID=3031130 RepID=A0ABT5WTB6_9SPHN|nr:DUF3089 domain-containing protein [Novosphingobium album (ex Liu et al. 2023)]MDE8652917.1 DUF3089 domain-containing protein [Novosphingobium album (ex Liu et al. 2023)]
MARKFLYVIAGIVVLVLAGLIALRIFAEDLTEMAFVPSAAFTPQPPLPEAAYAAPGMWIARPGMSAADPAAWRPPGLREPAGEAGKPLAVAVFFIHPTSHITRDSWNASLDDPVSRQRAALFVKGMASPFNRAAAIWAPRYRQAAVGAFLTDAPEAARALDLAYGDVLEAFDVFIRTVDPRQPIVLAGHSQGAFLLRRLMRDRIAGTPLAARVAAAYVVGWPVSLAHDLPAMGLPACTAPDQAGCVMSWLSVADPAETAMLLKAYARRPGLDGQRLDGTGMGDTAFLCTNPITGARDGRALARDNLGTLVPDVAAESGELVAGAVPAFCGEDHFLHIGPPPDLQLGPYVLPGNNYHLYDIPLFWANLRADFERRVKAWRPSR